VITKAPIPYQDRSKSTSHTEKHREMAEGRGSKAPLNPLCRGDGVTEARPGAKLWEPWEREQKALSAKSAGRQCGKDPESGRKGSSRLPLSATSKVWSISKNPNPLHKHLGF
jgi:hypothetical protein